MPEISQEAVAAQYRDASNLNARIALHQRFSTNQTGWTRWVFDQLTFPPECTILELGCGPANLWQQNADRIPEGWHITLSDFSPGMIEKAQENLGQAKQRYAFEVVDAQSIPFEDRRFDAVIANHMLYHVPDKASAFSEIRRVLKPGGQVVASTVGSSHLQQLHDLVARLSPDVDPWQNPARSFLLENGKAQLVAWFSDVRTYRYEDALVVTETEPLVAYVLSCMLGTVLTGELLARFTQLVQAELAQRGAIHITKDSGLFRAVCPPVRDGEER